MSSTAALVAAAVLLAARPASAARVRASHTVDVIAPGERVDTVIKKLRALPQPKLDRPAPRPPESAPKPPDRAGSGRARAPRR